ncbi:MAG TPA: type 4a pilus biogenesis protein PilO [Lacipirellulaceae bacterium]|jgi:Tfp pilus assembly protein PilO
MASCVLDPETVRFGRLLHYGGVAITLLCGAAAYAYLFTPIERDIFDVSVRIDELTESSRNASAIQGEHEKLSGRLKDIAARYASLQGRVPGSAEAGSFLKYVSDIARQENLSISDFQPARSVEGDGFTAMEVMLSGRGSFASICTFFDRLSKVTRLSKVKDLTVTTAEDGNEYPMKTTLVIYFGLTDKRAAAAKEASHG